MSIDFLIILSQIQCSCSIFKSPRPNLTLDIKKNDANSEISTLSLVRYVRRVYYHILINIRILLISFSSVGWRFMPF